MREIQYSVDGHARLDIMLKILLEQEQNLKPANFVIRLIIAKVQIVFAPIVSQATTALLELSVRPSSLALRALTSHPTARVIFQIARCARLDHSVLRAQHHLCCVSRETYALKLD